MNQSQIPAYQNIPARQHIDFIYVAQVIAISATLPSYHFQWFDWNDLQKMTPDVEIFKETLQVIQHLLDLLQNFNSLYLRLFFHQLQ